MSTEAEVIQSMEIWHQARMEDVHTMLPGKVQSYNPETRLATVKPSVSFRSLHGDIIDIPPIDSVPVVWPGSSDFSFHGALEAGSGVMLVFSESGIGGWLRGSQDMEADDETRFSLHDAVAVPGLWPVSRVPEHLFRTAQWGMASKDLEIGGTEDGKVSIANNTTTLKAEVERLWEAIDQMGTFVKTLAPLISPGVPTTPNPAQAGAITAAQVLWSIDKRSLGDILA